MFWNHFFFNFKLFSIIFFHISKIIYQVDKLLLSWEKLNPHGVIYLFLNI